MTPVGCDKCRGQTGSFSGRSPDRFGVDLAGMSPTGQPVRVLIAEDDARVRTALCSFLSGCPDLEIVGDAGSAATALALAKELAPAVALVDVRLPKASDGLGLMRTLTGELKIPVVAMSILGGFRMSALAAGAYQFLEKECAAELLIASLRAAATSPRPRYPRP